VDLHRAASREVDVLLDPRTIDRDALAGALAARGYIADDGLVMTLFLALRMERGLFVEGAPGVGKTMLALTLAEIFETRLLRLQCYEGLDLANAAYEWDYPRQLLELQAGRGAALYREELLLRRPLLQAIDASHARAPVLLVDEIDRADEEFEAFLLELLGDFQITIPELGTLRAEHRPIVILTSNRTREVHDALKRRCLYHWIDYPTAERELAIVRARVPELDAMLCGRVVAFVQALRGIDLAKAPGIAETVDWATALRVLGATRLDVETARPTLGLLLKYVDDIERVRGPLLDELIGVAASA
jgi:MoxR-like ATPase